MKQTGAAGYLGRASLDSTPHGQSVKQSSQGLADDSYKKAGHDPQKHMPRVAGSKQEDHKRAKESHVGAGNLGKALASTTTTPLNQGYGKPK